MMDRAQFMQELEKLLADISETERQDALDFYNSYLQNLQFLKFYKLSLPI